MGNDLKEKLRNNINVKNQNNTEISNVNADKSNDASTVVENKVFKLQRKVDDKTNKKSIPVYIEPEKLKRLDKACKDSNHSRNELINKMLDFCLDNLELEK